MRGERSLCTEICHQNADGGNIINSESHLLSHIVHLFYCYLQCTCIILCICPFLKKQQMALSLELHSHNTVECRGARDYKWGWYYRQWHHCKRSYTYYGISSCCFRAAICAVVTVAIEIWPEAPRVSEQGVCVRAIFTTIGCTGSTIWHIACTGCRSQEKLEKVSACIFSIFIPSTVFHSSDLWSRMTTKNTHWVHTEIVVQTSGLIAGAWAFSWWSLGFQIWNRPCHKSDTHVAFQLSQPQVFIQNQMDILLFQYQFPPVSPKGLPRC